MNIKVKGDRETLSVEKPYIKHILSDIKKSDT